MDNKANKRKIYIIDKQFQFRFVFTFLILIILSLVLFTAGFMGYYWIKYMAGENVFNEFIHVIRKVDILNDKGEVISSAPQNLGPYNPFEIYVPPILLNNLITMLVISILGIFYSHRIAGPVYRIQQDIKRVLNGEKGVTITLRRTDKLQELAEEINQLIRKVDEPK
jgi:methyl-accepting chemotaxis protein